jgi:hypothetical protein
MRFLGVTLLAVNPVSILRSLGPAAWPFVSKVRKDVEERFGGINMLKYLYHSECCTSAPHVAVIHVYVIMLRHA